MTAPFLLSRALLKFQSQDDALLGELSAVARTPEGDLWVGSDEYLSVERLSPMGNGIYAAHRPFHLKDYLPLADDKSEVDIEGLDYAAGYLWVVGSHSLKRGKPKGKKLAKDLARLAKIKRDDNRYLLARLPVNEGALIPTTDGIDARTAAKLKIVGKHNQLMAALRDDPHLGPLLDLPSKDNGFDIEGLAVTGQRIFLGLRGPVLGGWAIILEIELETDGDNPSTAGTLTLKTLQHGGVYRKHFLNLNGQGMRDLSVYQGELIILAGPTMALTGTMQVFRLQGAAGVRSEALPGSIWHQGDDLSLLFDLPLTPGSDYAEGITVVPCLEETAALMVVYDAPHPSRLSAFGILADIFRLP